jgi:hypothetical protein
MGAIPPSLLPVQSHEGGSMPAVAPYQHRHDDMSSRNALNRTALSATIHCLTGCAIEGVIGTALS